VDFRALGGFYGPVCCYFDEINRRERGKLRMKIWVIAGLLGTASTAQAADNIAKTFSAEAKDNSVTIYSTSKKARRCDVLVNFSVIQDGKRIAGLSHCSEKDIPAGKHVLVCDFTRPVVVEPKIEGPVQGKCR